jgi:hypothetical protein
MKVLVAVKRAIDPNVKVGVKGDVQVSTRIAFNPLRRRMRTRC